MVESKTITLRTTQAAQVRLDADVAIESSKVSLASVFGMSTEDGPSTVPTASLVLEPSTARLWAQTEIEVATDAGTSVAVDTGVAVKGAAIGLEAPGDAAVRVGPGVLGLEAPAITAAATGPMVMTGKPISLN